jgi:hypothetical protein
MPTKMDFTPEDITVPPIGVESSDHDDLGQEEDEPNEDEDGNIDGNEEHDDGNMGVGKASSGNDEDNAVDTEVIRVHIMNDETVDDRVYKHDDAQCERRPMESVAYKVDESTKSK